MAEGSRMTELDSALNELVAQSKSNPTLAKMMAIDASALLGEGEDRLAEIANKGFFKRLWSSVSGQTGAASRATAQDLVKMQELSWRYLHALQAQNLIDMRTTEVIRANLARLAETDARTNQLIGLLAQRQDELIRRQSATESVVAIIDWLNHVKARKDRSPPVLRALRVGIEYGFLINADEVSQVRLAQGDDITNALVGALVDVDSSIDAEHYLSQIIACHLDGSLHEMMASVSGLSQDHLALLQRTDVASITSDWVFGVGSSIYEAKDLIEHVSDDARSIVLRAAIAKNLGALSGTLTMKEFCTDLAATISLARSMLPSEAIEMTPRDLPSKTKASALFARRIPIKHHVLASMQVPADVRTLYPYSFALLFDEPSDISPAQTNFLASLAKALGTTFDDARFNSLVVDHGEFSLDLFLDAISQDKEHKTAWLVDAVAVISSGARGFSVEQTQRIRQAATSLDISAKHLDGVVPSAIVLMSSDLPRDVLEAVQDLSSLTQAWRAVLSYRRLSFARVMDDECEQLADLGTKRDGLLASLSMVTPSQSSLAEVRQRLSGDGLKGAAAIIAGAVMTVSLPVSVGVATAAIAGGVIYDKMTGAKIASTVSNEQLGGMLSAIRQHSIIHRSSVTPLLALVRAFGADISTPSDAWDTLEVEGDWLRKQAEDKNGAIAMGDLSKIQSALIALQQLDEVLIREIVSIEQS